MSASRVPSGAMEEAGVGETGHWTVTLTAVVPALAGAKLTVKTFESGFCAVNATGEPLSSRIALVGVTPLTVPLESTVAVKLSLGEA